MAPKTRVLDMLAKKLGHEPTKENLEALDYNGLLNLDEEFHSGPGKKRFIPSPFIPGQVLWIPESLNHGYFVTIPSPSKVQCKECLSTNHWEFVDVESQSAISSTFIFRCRHIFESKIGKWECLGECKIVG